MRTEQMPNAETTLEANKQKAASILHEYFLQNTNNSEIPAQRANEIAGYWTCRFLSDKNIEKVDSSAFQDNDFEKIKQILQTEEQSHDLKTYSEITHTDFAKLIQEKLKKEQRPVRILDINGNGKFFEELGSTFNPEDISCVSISPRLHKTPDFVDKHLGVPEILPQEWKNSFELITSLEAPMEFLNKKQAFYQALEALKPDGDMFYGTGTLNIPSDLNKELLTKFIAKQEGMTPQEFSNSFTYSREQDFLYEGQYERIFKGLDALFAMHFYQFEQELQDIDIPGFKLNFIPVKNHWIKNIIHAKKI